MGILLKYPFCYFYSNINYKITEWIFSGFIVILKKLISM